MAFSMRLLVAFVLAACLAAGVWAGSAAAQVDVEELGDTVMAAAAKAAADRLQIATDELVVVTTEPRDWPDSSLGCPQPGRAYAQIITPGYLVTIARLDDGDEVLVHTDENGQRVVIC
jgi:hypothetical protein